MGGRRQEYPSRRAAAPSACETSLPGGWRRASDIPEAEVSRVIDEIGKLDPSVKMAIAEVLEDTRRCDRIRQSFYGHELAGRSYYGSSFGPRAGFSVAKVPMVKLGLIRTRPEDGLCNVTPMAFRLRMHFNAHGVPGTSTSKGA